MENILNNTECCYYCRKYSTTRRRINGYCMKKRMPVKSKQTCGDFSPEYDVKYEHECKVPGANW